MILDVVQRTEAWHQVRLGKVTGSRIADVCAKTKSGYSASRANYMYELLLQRLTGQQAETYTNAAMRLGTEREPAARSAYELIHDVDVVEVGFVTHPTIIHSGASPDGLVGDEGLVEFKCPLAATHGSTLEEEKIPDRYLKQINWQLACMPERRWCDYNSYNPDYPGKMQLFVRRVWRDDSLIEELEGEVKKFLAELDEREATLRKKYDLPMAEAA